MWQRRPAFMSRSSMPRIHRKASLFTVAPPMDRSSLLRWRRPVPPRGAEGSPPSPTSTRTGMGRAWRRRTSEGAVVGGGSQAGARLANAVAGIGQLSASVDEHRSRRSDGSGRGSLYSARMARAGGTARRRATHGGRRGVAQSPMACAKKGLFAGLPASP